MSKSSLITMLALIASVSAKPYYYSVSTVPYAARAAAYTAADLYNPAGVAPLPASYAAGYPTTYSAYSNYPASYAATLPAAFSAPLQLPAVSAYGPSYPDELAALYNAVAPVAPVTSVAPVAPVAPPAFASAYSYPYSYFYKR